MRERIYFLSSTVSHFLAREKGSQRPIKHVLRHSSGGRRVGSHRQALKVDRKSTIIESTFVAVVFIELNSTQGRVGKRREIVALATLSSLLIVV